MNTPTKTGIFRLSARAAALCLGLAAVAAHARAATIREYPLLLGSQPLGITLGPLGDIWFVESNAAKIGRIDADGTLTELTLPQPGGFASQIINGGNGNVYFNEPGLGQIGLVHATGNLGIVEASLAGASGLAISGFALYLANGGASVPYTSLPSFQGGGLGCTLNDGPAHNFTQIATDIYGWIWMSDAGNNAIVSVTAPPGCNFLTHALPNAGSGPKGIAASPSGDVWFTEHDGNRIGRVHYDTGLVTEYALPAGSEPQMIAAAPDGTLWFAEAGTNKIGRITHNGAISEYPVPTPNSHPYGVAIGSDGSVWFTEEYGAKVGHLMLHPPGDVNGDGVVNVADVFYTINFLFAGGPEPK
jgi:virginiamycin B lyase